MIDPKDKIIVALKDVHGSYYDFVLGVYVTARNHDFLDELYSYLSENDSLSTDDVELFLESSLRLPKPLTPEQAINHTGNELSHLYSPSHGL